MEIRKTEFPVTLQAFEIRADAKEEFIAEQVVNSQTEADRFASRYNGKLIKAHALRPDEVRRNERFHPTRKSAFPAWAVFILVLIAFLVIAYFAGWLTPVIDRIR